MASQSKTKLCEESPRSIRLLPKSRTITRPFPPGFTPVIQVSSASKGAADGKSIFTPVFLSPSLLSPLPPPEDHKSNRKLERSPGLSTTPVIPALQLPARNRSKTLTYSPEAPKNSPRSPATPGSLRKLCHNFLGLRQEITSDPEPRPPLPTKTNKDAELLGPPGEKLSRSRLRCTSQHAFTLKPKTRYHHSPHHSTGALVASSAPAIAEKKATSTGRLQKAKSAGDLRAERVKSLNQEQSHEPFDYKENMLVTKFPRGKLPREARCEGMPLPTNEAFFELRDARKHMPPCVRDSVRSAAHLRPVTSHKERVITKSSHHKEEERLLDPSILADWANWKEEITELGYLTANHRLTCLT